MTQAPQSEPVLCATPEEAFARLRERGARLTSSRRLVLEALFAATAPLTAERIAGGTGLDLASVYRNLEVLERLGLVRHVHLGHGPGLYALLARGEREYLYCERCHDARPLEPAELDGIRAQLRERFGFAARFTHFPITGLCARCGGG